MDFKKVMFFLVFCLLVYISLYFIPEDYKICIGIPAALIIISVYLAYFIVFGREIVNRLKKSI